MLTAISRYGPRVISNTVQIIEDDTVREKTLELIRKYRVEEDVLPHWERIKGDRVILALRPDEMVWRDW